MVGIRGSGTPAAQQRQEHREGDRKRKQDDAIAHWLASAPSSVLDDVFNLTPVQLSLGMSKPIVFLANVALDFKNLFGPSQRRDLTADRVEEVQERFTELQVAYRRHLGAGSESAATAMQLHISPRMVVESDEEITAMKKLWSDCLEGGARSSEKSLEADIIMEEEAKERKEERRKRRLKKKRERRKGKRDSLKAKDSTDGKDTKGSLGAENKENATAQRIDENTSTEEKSLTECGTLVENNDDKEIVTNENAAAIVRRKESSTVQTDKSDPKAPTESSEGRSICMPSSPIKARSLCALATTGDTNEGVKIVSTAEPAPESNVEKSVLRPPPGIYSKDDDSAASSVVLGSYLEAARAAQLKAEVETLRNQLKTERTEHLEAVQQVQLKAFIAESRATAEAERAEKLEKLLAEVTESGCNVACAEEKYKPKEPEKAAVAARK